MNTSLRNSRRRDQRGNNIIEFAFVITPLIFLLMGVSTVSIALGTSIRVTQICRDSASMYVRGVDFSKPGNQDVLVRLADGMRITRTGGEGIIILSKVTWIPQSKCTALGLNPCNGNRHVITQRIYIGNRSIRQSTLGTPAGVDSSGLVTEYMTDPTAQANFNMMTLDEGQYAYVAETHFRAAMNGSDIYSRAIF